MSDEKHWTDDAPHATAEDYQRTGQRFVEAMRREFPDTLTVSTTCARCSATIDPAAVEQHHERCFVVGDWVRWTLGDGWVEGEVEEMRHGHVRAMRARRAENWWACERAIGAIVYPSGPDSRHVGSVRHIQRSGQAVPSGPLCHCQGFRNGRQCSEITRSHRGGGWRCPEHDACTTYVGNGDWCMFCGRGPTLHRKAPLVAVAADGSMTAGRPVVQRVGAEPPTPAPTLYDGLTSAVCYERWIDNRMQIEYGYPPVHVMTPAQIAVAKTEWISKYGQLNSIELRARISAAKERERLTVCMPVDAEDLPW